MLNKSEIICFCGSSKMFFECCEKYIKGTDLPDTPEQLMRSRYSAYHLKNENYLLQSWHTSTRPEQLHLNDDSTQWKKLKVIFAEEKQVHFIAYFSQDSLNKDKVYALSETSNFRKEERWFYIDGDNVNTVQLTKNMSCPCQSGNKYKRCCGKDI